MLSVIIPVYQAVDTLERCVLSVLAQELDDLEIVLVDDGSTDGSSELCNTLSDRYTNVVTKHIDNSGTYQARRQGALMARGDIITFVDADDWVEKGAYCELLGLYNKAKADVLLFAQRYGTDGDENVHCHIDGFYNKHDIQTKIIPTMIWDSKLCRAAIEPSVCSKLIRKELYLKVTNGVYDRIIWGEDAAVTYPLICLADKIYIYNKPYYHYCISDASCTRNYNVSRVKELQSFRRVLEDKLYQYSCFDFKWQIDCYMRMFLDMLSVGWFGCHRSSQLYAFPFSDIKFGSKVRLYGAGDVGKSFYHTIIQTGYVQLAGWYDKNADSIKEFCGQSIQGVENMQPEDDGIVLIAILNHKVSEDIRKDLVKKGFSDDQIFWKKPLTIG